MKPKKTAEEIRRVRFSELGAHSRDGAEDAKFSQLNAVLDSVAQAEAPPVSEALKLAQVRAALAAARPSGIRVRQREWRVSWWAGVGAFGAAAAVLAIFLAQRPSVAPSKDPLSVGQVIRGEFKISGMRSVEAIPAHQLLEVVGQRPGELRLSDGSQLTASVGTRLRVSSRAIDLNQGEVSLAVKKLPAQVGFIVVTPEAKIHVVGTHFSVLREDEASGTVVRVTEGKVEVEALLGGEHRLLGAGESWSISASSDQPQPPKTADPPVSAPQVSSSAPAPPSHALAPVLPAPRVASTSSELPQPKRAADKAKATEALRAAEELVAQGRFAEAISSYERLATTYPGTSQAEMARFAAASLAVQHGSRASAQKLLDRYLRDYPKGAFAAQARKLQQSLP